MPIVSSALIKCKRMGTLKEFRTTNRVYVHFRIKLAHGLLQDISRETFAFSWKYPFEFFIPFKTSYYDSWRHQSRPEWIIISVSVICMSSAVHAFTYLIVFYLKNEARMENFPHIRVKSFSERIHSHKRPLNNWNRAKHVCVSKLYHHWFRLCHVACSVPIHHLSKWWHIVNWTLINKLQKLNQNQKISI